MKLATKILIGVTGLIAAAAQSTAVQQAVSNFFTAHPHISSLASAVALIAALAHNPQASS